MIERVPSARVLLLFFGYLARTVEEQFVDLQHDLRGARMPITYHGYLARTMLYTVITFLAVVTLAVALSAVFFRTAALSAVNQFVLFLGFVFPAGIISYALYRFRLYYPSYIAEERARDIDRSMPNVTNFMLALSRAGVATSETLRVISEHSDVLGTAAEEFQYAYRDMAYFGADVVTALTHLSDTTFHDDLGDFIDGYLRALTGRGDTDVFLEEAMEDLFERAEIDQEDFLSSLGVLAEVYVAVFVAGPIFSLVILVVMGFMRSPGVLMGIRVIVYAMVPLTAVGFLILLDIYMSNPLAGGGEHHELETTDIYDLYLSEIGQDDRGKEEAVRENIRRLERYQVKRTLVRFLGQPLTLLRREPVYALYVGAFLGTMYVLGKGALSFVAPETPLVAPVPPGAGPSDLLRALDDTVVEGLMLGTLFYTVFYELRARYLASLEDQLPHFLDELADRHQIGMSLSESITSLTDQDMDALNVELERMSRDFRLQGNATDVLRRFANRVRSPVVTRVVVLLSAANDTADRLAPVIEALADRADLSQRLKHERQVEMSLYVVIIYISFFVFLVILTILHEVFLPKVPTGDIGGTGFLSGGTFQLEAYKTLFYHMAVLQGLFSGLVGGKMSSGEVPAGAKHALVMVVISYVLFVLVLPNVQISI